MIRDNFTITWQKRQLPENRQPIYALCYMLKLSLIGKQKQKSDSLQTTAAKYCPEDGG